MMTTTAPNSGSAGGAVPSSTLPAHLQLPGLHPSTHPQTTLLLHPSSQHPLLLHPHHPHHLLHSINSGLHPPIAGHLMPSTRSGSTAIQPFYGHRGVSASGLTRPTVHHPFPHRPPTPPPQQPPTPPDGRHHHHQQQHQNHNRELDSPIGKQSLPQTPSPPLPTPPPSAHAPSERRRSEAESPSEASGGEESRLRERLGTGLVMGGRDLSSPAESDDEELSVGSESPPPPATTPLSPAPTASESASPTPPPQPPPASPPPQPPPPHRSLKFSIDNILRPEFGKKGSSECEGKSGNKRDVGIEGKSPLDLSASVSPGVLPPSQQQQQQQPSAVAPPSSGGKTASSGSSASSVASSSSSGSSSTSSSNGSGQPLLWPAWVYCTRYSDRPSSGPRSRRVKRKERTKGDVSSGEEKRPRTAFSAEQLSRLKQEFAESRYLTEKRRQALARDLRLNESQIKIWFQNKRAKIKKASGQRNPLALQLMAQGLYNHSTVSSSPPQAGGTPMVTPPVGGPRSNESEGEERCRTDDEGSRTPGKRAGQSMSPVSDSSRIGTALEGM